MSLTDESHSINIASSQQKMEARPAEAGAGLSSAVLMAYPRLGLHDGESLLVNGSLLQGNRGRCRLV